ncbi:MAG: zinc ribbon domain-containing protein [Erysipelotrichaceae bacterium]|nr:zinc ribbon domain-containing protein [Erysipelotrichaceae bacterium]
MAKYCIKCGAELRPDSKFCLKCGEPVKGHNKKIKITEDGKGGLNFDVPDGTTVTISDEMPQQKKSVNRTVKKETAVKEKKKSKGGFTRFIIFVLVIAIGFTGFVKPGFILKWIKDKPSINPPTGGNVINNDDDPEALFIYNNTNTSNVIPDLAEELGNSAPLSYSPLNGFRIEAEANAFLEDTNITMSPLEDLDQTTIRVVDELSEEGYYPIGFYEVDGGLDDEEIIPGEYTVSVDPAVFDVDPALYEYIRVFRIGDDGVYYECSSYMEDGKIVYRSDQNCITFYVISAIAIIATLGIGVYLEQGRPVQYFYDAKKDKLTYSETYNGISFKIHFNLGDIGENIDYETRRMQEICESYARKGDELYKQYKLEHMFNASKAGDYYTATKSVAQVIYEAVQNDEEYKKLKERKEKPGIIDTIVDYTKKSFDYLKNREYVKMPTGTVEITCVNMGGNLAEASTRNYHEGYIELHIADVLKGDKAKKYNLLLTMSHEILHVCQQKYRAFFADSNRYDEMAAVYMEDRALEHFISTGDIEPGLSLEMSPTSYWSTLKLPLDKSTDNKELMKHQGYLLSLLVKYLQQRTGETIWIEKIMRARSYIKEPGISNPLMSVFKIPETEFDAYYHNFIRMNRKKLAEQYNKGEREFMGNEPIEIIKGEKYHVRVEAIGSYSSEIRGFRQADFSPMTLLWIPDEGLFEEQNELQVFPIDNYAKIAKGAYIYPVDKNALLELNTMRDILEIHGKIPSGVEASLGTEFSKRHRGYTIYVFDKTKAPSLGENETELIIRLPENSTVAKDKVIDGYLLKLETEEGKKLEYEITPEYFEKEFNIKKKDLFDKKDESEELIVYATLIEFVRNKDGDKLYGEESDDVTYVMNVPQASGLEEFTGLWIPMEDKKPTGDSFVLGLIYVPDYNEFGYFESQYKYWNNEGRWHEMSNFIYDEKSGDLTISFDRGNATFRLLDKNTLRMINYGGTYEFYRWED